MKGIILLFAVCGLLNSCAALQLPKSSQEETLVYPDGSRYAGQVKDGQPHGEGTMTYPDGRKYAGRWENNFFCLTQCCNAIVLAANKVNIRAKQKGK